MYLSFLWKQTSGYFVLSKKVSLDQDNSERVIRVFREIPGLKIGELIDEIFKTSSDVDGWMVNN